MVCLPTYNERDNLEPMVRALGEQLDTSRDRVLVIDDNSPDGTGELADALAAELPWVDVLHRPEKQGLGPAYIAGFRHAIAAGAELVIEIDCDFSHDPADVPRLIASCEGGIDVTLGSRWVDGGGTVNWGAGTEAHLARGQSLRPNHPRGRRARPHGRLQVLSPRGARGDRRSTRSPRRGTGFRSRPPTGCCGKGSRSSRSRSRSWTVASANRRWADRSSSRRCSRCPCFGIARSAASCSPHAPPRRGGIAGERSDPTYTSCHGRGHRRDIRRPTSCRARYP